MKAIGLFLFGFLLLFGTLNPSLVAQVQATENSGAKPEPGIVLAKTGAFMIGGGAGISILGIGLIAASMTEEISPLVTKIAFGSLWVGPALVVLGLIPLAVSIPLKIASKNKKQKIAYYPESIHSWWSVSPAIQIRNNQQFVGAQIRIVF